MSFSQPIISLTEAEAPFFWGVDIGGTNIKVGLVDERGRTLAFQSIHTDPSTKPHVACLRIAETCRSLAANIALPFDSIARGCLGAPGPICLKRGMLLNPTNLPEWHQFPIQQAVAEAVGTDFSFINDANAAAFGEFWVGSGVDAESLVLLTLGTGVGGGIISSGNLINGSNSFGSELGHVVVDSRPDARLCSWGGGRGQLEAYASASAVALRAREAVAEGVQTSLSEIGMQGDPLSAKDVYLAAVAGDPFALSLIDDTARYLGIGITCAVHTVDPGLVVLGGAMNFGGHECAVGGRFLQGISDEFKSRTFENVFHGTRIAFASLGGDAGYIGAAGIARQDYLAT
ncbi:ROK family protein [Aureliella helgolandensis]|uniref:Glucokinase n=1 Tax=Aureliella helgolandensis TaxID=2527968 RepID=A0A518G8J8_9BACT|nr:ROK family protein [Aureliella helgolandensis]QDV24916.1 Glucokinase [Aureliella helgolandensis]